MDALFLLAIPFLIFLGPILSSFFAAQIMRMEKITKANSTRSACDHCGHELAWYDLIPLVSFIIQRGKCRYCHKRIDIRIFLSEVMGLVFWSILAYGLLNETATNSDYVSLALWMLISSMVLVVLLYLAIYDLFTFSIPADALNVLTFIAVAINVIALVTRLLDIAPFNSALVQYGQFTNLLAAVAAGCGMAVIIYFTRNQGMGIGDLFLAIVIALMLDWRSAVSAFYVIIISAAIVGVFYTIRIKKFKGVRIPLVPFIVFGYVVSLVWGLELFRAMFFYL